MAGNVKRLNVSLPLEQVERIKSLMNDDPAHYPSMSAFVTEAVENRLSDAEAHDTLLVVLRELGGEPTVEDRQWAEKALRAADRATEGQQFDTRHVA